MKNPVSSLQETGFSVSKYDHENTKVIKDEILRFFSVIRDTYILLAPGLSEKIRKSKK